MGDIFELDSCAAAIKTVLFYKARLLLVRLFAKSGLHSAPALTRWGLLAHTL